MLKPLETVRTPSTASMYDFSDYLQSCVDQYWNYLKTLQENGPAVERSWEGDIDDAYASIRGRLVEIGNIHIAQLEKASGIFRTTAEMLDRGNEMQGSAKLLWLQARAEYENPLTVALGRATEMVAERLQGEALAVISSARVIFNSGFAHLTAAIAGAPNVSDLSGLAGVPVKGPGAKLPKGGQLPFTHTH